MACESLREFLDRRERELTQQLSALQAEMSRRQAELDEIRRVLSTLGIEHSGGLEGNPENFEAVAGEGQVPEVVAPSPTGLDAFADGLVGLSVTTGRVRRAIAEAADRYPFAQFEHLTIKELIVKALIDHFPQGTSAAEMVRFISNAYGRVVERSSLSPQLSRLKDDGWVEQRADNTWNLTAEKRRAFVMFDHPSSRKAMTHGLRKD